MAIVRSLVETHGGTVHASRRILIVDDETDARELIAFILEQYGAKITAVASAGEALTVLPRWS